jgi:DNA recombination protein RmuC
MGQALPNQLSCLFGLEVDFMDFAVLGAAIISMLASIAAAVFAFRAASGSRDASAIDRFCDVVRKENELARNAAEDHARGLRHEIGEITRSATKEIAERINAIGVKLDSDIAQMARDAILGREALQTLIEQRLNEAANAQGIAAANQRQEVVSMLQQLGGSTGDSLRQIGEQQKERLDKVAEELRTLTEKGERAQETLRQAVETRLDAIRQENATKLEEMRQTVDEKLQSTLEQRLGDSFNMVVEQLKRVHEGLGEMQTLASGVGDLKKVLSNVSVRGTFGELQLGNLLDQFLSQEQFIRNATVKEGSSERVEFAVRLPGRDRDAEVLLPIDAKFPQEDYLRLLAAVERGDAGAVSEAGTALEKTIRLCAKTISGKYINSPRTTDFAILFLPTESLYAEVLRKPGLFEQLQRDFHVTITGPVTLTALLNALQMGFRTLAIEKRSSEVWQVLGAVRTEFGKYNQVVEKLARNLTTAASSVEELGKRTRAMGSRLKTVESLDPDTAQSLLGLSGNDIETADENDEAAIAAQ